ncbi:MAG: hypothetical protein IJ934_06895 [Acetobacter sp.]|nr:hypothetical protein [Acetobacter sp.]
MKKFTIFTVCPMALSLSACGKKSVEIPKPTKETCSDNYLGNHPKLLKLVQAAANEAIGINMGGQTTPEARRFREACLEIIKSQNKVVPPGPPRPLD